jgi:putative transposase
MPRLPQLRRLPKLRRIFAGRLYRGPKLRDALADLEKWTIAIVTRSQSVVTFVPEPRRWTVERTFAWFGRNRRLGEGFEATIAAPMPGSPSQYVPAILPPRRA